MTISFYKSGENWIFNGFLTPAGSMKLDVSQKPAVSFYYASNGEPVFDAAILATDIIDESGSPYSDYTSFISSVGEFFTGPSSSGASAGGATLKAFSVELKRPIDGGTALYSAGDVIASTAFLPILDVAKETGLGVRITRVRIQTSDTGVSGKKFNVHFYKEAPTFIADNAAFAVDYANAAKRVGAIPVVMGTGNMSTVGMNDWNHVVLNPTARDVYWILETVDGFTPSASSTKFQITIDCELSNN